VLRSPLNTHYRKKGQIWVSAALYTALGLILITVILSVGMPFVNKIKERNTILQTKNVLFELDKVIREVDLEGVGSRRPFFIEIQEGELSINDLTVDETITWMLISEDKLGIESGENVGDSGPRIDEGNLKIQSNRVGQGYEINLWLDFKTNGINIKSDLDKLSGQYNLVIEHKKSSAEGDYVEIKET
jgi:hypothetical protein